jgi:hypothetical protein
LTFARLKTIDESARKAILTKSDCDPFSPMNLRDADPCELHDKRMLTSPTSRGISPTKKSTVPMQFRVM